MFQALVQRVKNRHHSDRADSQTVSMIFLAPLLLGLLMTMIDTSVYFGNRAVIQNVSRDAARTAAIFGGPGNATSQSELEQQYSFAGCAKIGNATLAHNSLVECALENNLAKNSGLTAVKIKNINCYVEGGSLASLGLTSQVGTPIFCQVTWEYGGIPGSALGFIGGNSTDGQILKNNTTLVSVQSEVGLAPEDVRGR